VLLLTPLAAPSATFADPLFQVSWQAGRGRVRPAPTASSGGCVGTDVLPFFDLSASGTYTTTPVLVFAFHNSCCCRSFSLRPRVPSSTSGGLPGASGVASAQHWGRTHGFAPLRRHQVTSLKITCLVTRGFEKRRALCGGATTPTPSKTTCDRLHSGRGRRCARGGRGSRGRGRRRRGLGKGLGRRRTTQRAPQRTENTIHAAKIPRQRWDLDRRSDHKGRWPKQWVEEGRGDWTASKDKEALIHEGCAGRQWNANGQTWTPISC